MEGNTNWRELQLTCAKGSRVQQSDTKIDFGIDAYCDDNKKRQVSQVTGDKVTWWKDIYLGSPIRVTLSTVRGANYRGPVTVPPPREIDQHPLLFTNSLWVL